MLTAQDIQDKAFEKASRGYNMDQVDEFLDEVAATISSLNAENASLRGKMKVLTQKVDEYRQTEDSMRLALLSAQKLSSQIEAEARQRADALVAGAQEQADRLTREAQDGIANEQAKLEEAKKATDRFFEHMRTVCQKQIEFYDKLSAMHLIGEEPAAEAEAEPDAEPAQPVRRPEGGRAARRAAAEAAEAAAETEQPAEPDEPAPEEPEPAPAEPAEPQLPQQDGDPTKYYGKKKKKRSFDDFSFGDDIL